MVNHTIDTTRCELSRQAICASADNVDTSDGKNSFHAMTSSVYQPVSVGESLARYFNGPSKHAYRVPIPTDITEQTDVSNEITIPMETIAINDIPDLKLDSVTTTTETVLTVPVECAVVNNELENVDNQQKPVWSAYNSLLNSLPSDQQSPVTVDKVYSLPITNAPLQE